MVPGWLTPVRHHGAQRALLQQRSRQVESGLSFDELRAGEPGLQSDAGLTAAGQRCRQVQLEISTKEAAPIHDNATLAINHDAIIQKVN